MISSTMQLYCGGRFLFGLHNPQQVQIYDERTQGYKWVGKSDREFFKDFAERVLSRGPEFISSDPRPFVPNSFYTFQVMLKAILQIQNGGLVGTMFAITNNSQPKAREYLRACGFKEENLPSKFGPAEPQPLPCILHKGDYHSTLKPFLANIPNYSPQSLDKILQLIEEHSN